MNTVFINTWLFCCLHMAFIMVKLIQLLINNYIVNTELIVVIIWDITVLKNLKAMALTFKKHLGLRCCIIFDYIKLFNKLWYTIGFRISGLGIFEYQQ